MRRKGIMLCYPFEEKRLYRWHVPAVYVQPKLDGIRCRAIISKNGVELLSSEEHEIISVEHICEDLQRLSTEWSITDQTIELDGELYNHNLSFQEIESRVGRTKNIHTSSRLIQLHVFDVVMERKFQMERFEFLNKLLKSETEYVKRVRTDIAHNVIEIMHYLHIYKSEGYEGIIVRNPLSQYERKRSTSIMKFKPRRSDIYRIVGYKEEIDKYGNPKGRLGALICETDGLEFSVGSGFTEEQRVNLWKEKESLIGKYVEVAYQHLTTGKKVPRFPVFLSILEEEEIIGIG